MKICIINGSPKASKSTSELLIEYLIPFIKGNKVVIYNVRKMDFSKTQFSQIQNSEVLIFVFPLYIDSLNSRLLRFLIELEKRGFSNKNINVYCMINNGFYEGWQSCVAADMKMSLIKTAICGDIQKELEIIWAALDTYAKAHSELLFRLQNNRLIIVCNNTCSEQLKLSGSLPAGKGIGISSILTVCQKHDGTLDYRIEDDVCSACAVLHL